MRKPVKKKLLIAIVVLLIIDQLKMYIYKLGFNNPNNLSLVVATYFFSLCLSIILIIVLGKLFLKKDNEIK